MDFEKSDPPSEIALSCGNAESGYAKRRERETTCGYAKGVDDINTLHLSPRAVICLPRIAKPAPPVVMDERTADTFRLDACPVEELLCGRSIVCSLRDGTSRR